MRGRWANIWVVAKREMVERLRKKLFWIFTILTPVLLIGLMVLPAALMMVRGEQASEIVLIDETGWAGPALLDLSMAEEGKKRQANDAIPAGGDMTEQAEAVNQASLESYRVRFRPAGEGDSIDSLKASIEAKELDGVLVVEADEERDARAVFYAQNLGNVHLMEWMKRSLYKVALVHRLEGEGVDPSLAEKLRKGIRIEAVKVEKGGKIKKTDFLVEYLKAVCMAMLLYMLIIMYGTALMRGVMEEKTGKVVEVLLSSVRPFELMLGKIIGISVVGLFQYALWFALGFGVVLANPAGFVQAAGSVVLKPVEMICLVVYFLLGFFFYASIYAAVGAVCSSEQEAQQWQTPIAMCLILPILVLPILVRDPHATWVVVFSMIPIFSPTFMIVRTSLVDVPLWELALSLTLLLGGIFFMAFLGGRIYRVGILMTGKRPSIPEIFRWLRQRDA